MFKFLNTLLKKIFFWKKQIEEMEDCCAIPRVLTEDTAVACSGKALRQVITHIPSFDGGPGLAGREEEVTSVWVDEAYSNTEIRYFFNNNTRTVFKYPVIGVGFIGVEGKPSYTELTKEEFEVFQLLEGGIDGYKVGDLVKVDTYVGLTHLSCVAEVIDLDPGKNPNILVSSYDIDGHAGLANTINWLPGYREVRREARTSCWWVSSSELEPYEGDEYVSVN